MDCIRASALGLAAGSLLTSGFLAPTPAGAQELEEVIVTARKREESLQEIPVAITAFTADDIINADLRGLDDVSRLSAGFQFFNQGNQQPGRYNTQLQFRGLTTAQFSPSFATGALFIDGVYVLNGGTSLSLMDLERIEVIKGPQAAYFGRNTFGGAVNLITRNPNLEEFGGEVQVRSSDRSNNDFNFFVEGPIIENKLGFSLAGRRYDKSGQYTATDGGSLGDEETTTFNGVLFWEPTDALSFKLRYAVSEDDDGAPAQGFVSGIANDSCTGRTIQSPEGPANPQRYICGQVPSPESSRTVFGGPFSSNTVIPAFILNSAFLSVDPISGTPGVDGIGLKRETERLSLIASYDWNDYNVEFIFGSNEQQADWVRDFDLSDRVGWFSRDPQDMEDTSYEIRLTSPQDGRFRWVVGFNRYEQEFTASGTGGNAVTGCFSPAPTLTDDSSTCIPNFAFNFPAVLRNSDEADVTGFFGAVDFDVTDQITLIAEARFQEDEIRKGGNIQSAGSTESPFAETYDDFLPRIIARWQPTDSTNLYVSYAKGHIAGDFNVNVLQADAREQAQYAAAGDFVGLLPAEELDAIEFGWKQTWAEGRGQLNFSIYRNEWTGIKGRSSVLVNETCRAGDVGSDPFCDPANGIGVGDPKQQIINGVLVPAFNSRNTLIPGDATINGWELETLLRPTDEWILTFNLTHIDSEYDDYNFNFVQPIAGFSQMRGNQTPRQPEWSANASATYLFNIGNLNAFFRGDMVYQGRSFVDESNLAFLDDYTLFHLRAGIEGESYRAEFFINNALNTVEWQTGARWTDFSSPTQFAFLTAKQGVAVSPLDKREVGLRLSYRF